MKAKPLARCIDKKFKRAEVAIVRGLRELQRGVVERRANIRRETWRRRDLDDLLALALDAAFAFVQMADAALPVADDLHLDVARARK